MLLLQHSGGYQTFANSNNQKQQNHRKDMLNIKARQDILRCHLPSSSTIIIMVVETNWWAQYFTDLSIYRVFKNLTPTKYKKINTQRLTWDAMYIAAAATEMGDRPGTISMSTAFLAMCVAAFCTDVGRPRFEQKRDMKSPVVMRSTCVSKAFKISLKHLPISFLLILLTAQISWKKKKHDERLHLLMQSIHGSPTTTKFHLNFKTVSVITELLIFVFIFRQTLQSTLTLKVRGTPSCRQAM